MKNLFKILALVTVFGFVSCTDNEEIVTENEKIINTQEVFGKDKDHETNINNSGEEGNTDRDDE